MDNTQSLSVKTEITTVKKKNIGICCLKMLMCFEVIICHYGFADDRFYNLAIPFYRISQIAVPAFMFASFYLTANIFLNPSYDKMIARCKRILIPFIGWGLLSYFLTIIICQFPQSYILNILGVGSNVSPSIKELFWQLLTGHSRINSPLWFMWDMLVISLLFITISSFSQKYFIRNILILSLVCFSIQYSGLNNILYNLRYELCYPLGRLAEMIPIAAFGIFIAYSGYFESVKRITKLRFIILLASSTLFLTMTFLWNDWSRGFGFQYAGVPLMMNGFLIFCIFFFTPFEFLPERVKTFLNGFTAFTLGIYCVHIIIGKVVLITAYAINPILTEYRFILLIVIYAIGFVLCSLINKINHPLAKQLVN